MASARVVHAALRAPLRNRAGLHHARTGHESDGTAVTSLSAKAATLQQRGPILGSDLGSARFNDLPAGPESGSSVSPLKPKPCLVGGRRVEEGLVGGLLDAAMQIAAERNGLLRAMRAALENEDNETALNYARRLCGLHITATRH